MENYSIICSSGKKSDCTHFWSVIRLNVYCYVQITKEDIDGYRTGQGILSCQLIAEWTKQSKPSRFIHKVILEGAKKPFNYLRIVLDCDIISPTGILTLMTKSLGGQCILTTSLTLLLFHADDNILHPC